MWGGRRRTWRSCFTRMAWIGPHASCGGTTATAVWCVLLGMACDSMQLDALLHVQRPNTLFERGEGLGRRVRPVVLGGQPAVVQRPRQEADAFLVAGLDVPVPHPLGHGRKQPLDAGLL